MRHGVEAVCRERPINHARQRIDAEGEQVAQEFADDVERQIENEKHHAEKDRDRRVFSGQDAVELAAAGVLAALVRLYDRLRHGVFNEAVAHVRQRRVAVKTALLLHLHDGVLDQLQLVRVELKLVRDRFIALDELCCRKADGDARRLRVVLDYMADRVDAAVDGALRAEVIDARLLAQTRRADGDFDQLLHALAVCRADGHDGHAQKLGQERRIDRAAVSGQLVHHVERQHRGRLERQELERQIEVALKVRRVHDVDDAVRLLIENEVPGHDLLGGVRPQRVNARQIDNGAVLLPAHLPAFLIDRHAGEVADVLVRAGELVKERCLAAVLIACECEDHASTSTSMPLASSLRSVST